MSRYESEGEYSISGYHVEGDDLQDGEAIALRAEAKTATWMLSGTVEILERDADWIAKIHPGELWRWPRGEPRERERFSRSQYDHWISQSVRYDEKDTFDTVPGISDSGWTLNLMLRTLDVVGGTVSESDDCVAGEITHIVCGMLVDPEALFRGVEWSGGGGNGNGDGDGDHQREAER